MTRPEIEKKRGTERATTLLAASRRRQLSRELLAVRCPIL